jgi:diaminopimelate decarboxylase
VNPDVDARTHPYISTGLSRNKFGVPVEEALRLYALAARDPALKIKGVAMHIGSQLTDVAPVVAAIGRLRRLVKELERQGIAVGHLDVGGGLGIPYDGEAPPHPDAYGSAVKRALSGFEGEVLLEPGRLLVGNAGVLLTRVLYRKRNGKRLFVVVDAAMNDLVRPSLYGAHHEIEPAGAPSGRQVVCDVVGPICETGDFLARRRRLPEPSPGDLLCVRSAGAYGFSMSSNYNARPRVAELLVDGARVQLARRRETYADLIRGEHTGRSPEPFKAGRRMR